MTRMGRRRIHIRLYFQIRRRRPGSAKGSPARSGAGAMQAPCSHIRAAASPKWARTDPVITGPPCRDRDIGPVGPKPEAYLLPVGRAEA